MHRFPLRHISYIYAFGALLIFIAGFALAQPATAVIKSPAGISDATRKAFDLTVNAKNLNDHINALALAQSALKKGDPYANYVIGLALKAGAGKFYDQVKITKHFQQAADFGIPQAMLETAKLYSDCRCLRKRKAWAISSAYAQKAVNHGIADGYYYLASNNYRLKKSNTKKHRNELIRAKGKGSEKAIIYFLLDGASRSILAKQFHYQSSKNVAELEKLAKAGSLEAQDTLLAVISISTGINPNTRARLASLFLDHSIKSAELGSGEGFDMLMYQIRKGYISIGQLHKRLDDLNISTTNYKNVKTLAINATRRGYFSATIRISNAYQNGSGKQFFPREKALFFHSLLKHATDSDTRFWLASMTKRYNNNRTTLNEPYLNEQQTVAKQKQKDIRKTARLEQQRKDKIINQKKAIIREAKRKKAYAEKIQKSGGYWAFAMRPQGRGHALGLGKTKDAAFKDAVKNCSTTKGYGSKLINAVYKCKPKYTFNFLEEECITLISSYHSGGLIHKFVGLGDGVDSNPRRASVTSAHKFCVSFNNGDRRPCSYPWDIGKVNTYTYCSSSARHQYPGKP